MPAPCDNSRHCLLSRHCECSEAIWGGEAGVQRAPPFGRGLGVSASLQGASRGDRPLWQEVWRVSLQSFTNLPPTYQEGGQGDGAKRPPAYKGRPEGIAPSGRRFGGCPSRAILICPLPTRKGLGGWFLTTYGISSSLPMLSRPWSARCASAACDSGYSVMRTSSTPLWAQSSTSLALSNHCSRVPVKWPIPVRVT